MHEENSLWNYLESGRSLRRSPLPTGLKDFIHEYKWDGRPFLLVGMGPSFHGIGSFDLSGYNVLGINKVVREIPVDIVHINDFYIVDKVKEWIAKRAKYLVLPYFPHFACRPNIHLTLQECMSNHPLAPITYGFNLSTIPFIVGDSPVIKANYFSAESALNLIAHTGCKEVYAIGIDGGKGERSKEFSDHGPCDPRGFDLQWDNMARTIKAFNLSYSNLDGSDLNPNLKEKLWQT